MLALEEKKKIKTKTTKLKTKMKSEEMGAKHWKQPSKYLEMRVAKAHLSIKCLDYAVNCGCGNIRQAKQQKLSA